MSKIRDTQITSLENQVYVQDTYLGQRYGVARQTIWRWVQSKNFPAPKKFSPGCSRWYLPDVEAWEKSRPGGGGVAMSRKEKALDRANPGQKKIQAAGLDKFIFNSSVMRKSQAILAGYVLSCLIEILYWMNWPKWKFASRLVDRLTVILEGQP